MIEYELLKALIIFLAIFDSEPFIKLSNKLLIKWKLPLFLNKLLECNYCIAFWLSIPVSFFLLSTTPTFIAIVGTIAWNKTNK